MKIESSVLAVLEEATTDGNRLVMAGQISRPTYVAVDRVLQALGGRWSRKDRAHVFDGPAIDAIEPVLQSGEYTRDKQDLGQFDTPPSLAAAVVEAAGIEPGMSTLEPSAGGGNLVHCMLAAGASRIHAVEIYPKLARHLEQRFKSFSGDAAAEGQIVEISERDFLTVDPEAVFDRVVMNPPFARQADIDHVRHAFEFLRPGGRVVAIMSAGTAFRTNRKAVEFRDLVASSAGTIEALPDKSFAESGTDVRTVLVTLERIGRRS